jgi:hypothetical protein
VARTKDFGVAPLACPERHHVGLRITMLHSHRTRRVRVACEQCPWSISPGQPGQAYEYLHAVGRTLDGRRFRN